MDRNGFQYVLVIFSWNLLFYLFGLKYGKARILDLKIEKSQREKSKKSRKTVKKTVLQSQT